MFAAHTDIAMGGNQPIVYRNSQAQGQPRIPSQQHPQQHQHPQQQHPQQQQMLSQYGAYQQQQPQQPYMPYANASKDASKGGVVNSMAFQSYVPPQQMFPYGYPTQQPASNQYAAQQPQQPQPQPQQMQIPTHPRHLGYHQQGNSNSTNQYVGSSGGHMGYRGGRGRGGMRGAGYGQFHRQVHNNHFYNQQHHYSSNNAVPERTPTVHLIHPDTRRVISVKLNRIYSTMADIRPQLQHQKLPHHGGNDSNEASASISASEMERSDDKSEAGPVPKFDPKSTKLVLCLNFLSPHGCIHGSGCDKVHIAGHEYTWPQIEATEVEKEGKRAYTAGFHVHCYDPTLTRYYKVPSESVYVTKGSANYVTVHNDHGDNFKAKFKLCHTVIDHSDCAAAEQCEDIHCSVQDLETVRESSANATHLNNAEAMADVPRLPADMVVRVYNQNSFETSHDYPGSNVLMTEGAKTYHKQYEAEMNKVPTRKRMQHCAHFRLKDMCRLGESCRFLHVLPTEKEIKERVEAEAVAAAKTKEEEEGREAVAASTSAPAE